MNLDRLRTFQLVVELESFSRAAERLFLSQPAVSLQVRQLERELGAMLIDRGGGRLRPTPAGAVVLEFAERVNDEHTDLLRRLASLQSDRLLVAVGCSSTSAKQFMPLVMSEVQRRSPEIHVRVHVLSPDEAAAKLAKGDLDLILTTDEHLSDKFEATPYTVARLFLVGPPTHPLARKARVAAEEVVKYPFALLPPPWTAQARFREWAANQGVEIKVVMELASYDGLIEAARKGLALSLISETAVAEEIARGQLAMIRTPGLPIEYPIFLAHRAGSLSPQAVLVKAIALDRKLSQSLPRFERAVGTD